VIRLAQNRLQGILKRFCAVIRGCDDAYLHIRNCLQSAKVRLSFEICKRENSFFSCISKTEDSAKRLSTCWSARTKTQSKVRLSFEIHKKNYKICILHFAFPKWYD
jgi:hypothetical protein